MKNTIENIENFMKLALNQAHIAYEQNEIPVGAIVTYKDKIVGKGYNKIEGLQDATAHAEIIAITSAENTLGNWRLKDCDIYVSLEPCIMCSGAIINSRASRILFPRALGMFPISIIFPSRI